MLIGGIILGVVVILLIVMFNSLVVKRNAVDNAFAAIDAQLKKRCDMIPNLVASAKAYMKHESETLTNITALRAQAMKPDLTPEEKIQLDNKITGAMRGFMVQMESYPDLKASDNIQMLMRSLNEVEEQLSAARRTYNAAVTEFNNSIQVFPACVFAGMMGFTKKELFSIPEAERANPNVGQLFN